MIYVGIDNGITGSISFIKDTGECLDFVLTESIHEQSYTKTKKNIGRLNYKWFYKLIYSYSIEDELRIFMERPMINPSRFDATMSAVRCLEAMLICIEDLQLHRAYVDSREWQKSLLPSGIKGSDEQKKASKDIGCRLFPQHSELITKHKDADGLLIAEWARRNKL